MSESIRLLIVDDEVRFLETLAQRLRLRGFDVTTAGSGQEAIDMARGQEFDLALLDLKMPGMSGEQVLAAFKEEHPYTEVVILTGHASIPSAVQCTQIGSHNYLQKPCETEELLEALKSAYQKRVKRKLKIDQEKLDRMLQISMGESPLGIIRRLKKIETEGE
jgi:DNA-binding NtrC family response regulator